MILSTAVVFLVAGFVPGPQTTGVLDLDGQSPIAATLAELARFRVVHRTACGSAGPTCARAGACRPGAGVRPPLTLLITAGSAYFVAGLDWPEALLIDAVLAPTDSVFFAVAAGSGDLHLAEPGVELLLGLVIGVVVPVAAILLERTRWFAASVAYEPLNGFATGLLVPAVDTVTHANLFLAAFAAGITAASFGPRQRVAFEYFGENIVWSPAPSTKAARGSALAWRVLPPCCDRPPRLPVTVAWSGAGAGARGGTEPQWRCRLDRQQRSRVQSGLMGLHACLPAATAGRSSFVSATLQCREG